MSATATYPQIRDLPLKISEETCKGKIYIVTGANTGLGLEAARHLVHHGAAKVILAVRNLEAGEAARKDIDGPSDVAEVWHLDLASYSSVKTFADKANSLTRIDGIIENAAVAGLPDIFAEGHRIGLTVNVLSTFYLAILLLPKLKHQGDARLSFVVSGAGIGHSHLLELLGDDNIISALDGEKTKESIYPATKLVQIAVVKHLRTYRGVVINSVNPGLCVTDLSRNAPEAFREKLRQWWAESGRTAEEGSRTLLAGVAAGENSHGCYMNDCEVADDQLPSSIDTTLAESVWNAVRTELEKIDKEAVDRCFTA